MKTLLLISLFAFGSPDCPKPSFKTFSSRCPCQRKIDTITVRVHYNFGKIRLYKDVKCVTSFYIKDGCLLLKNKDGMVGYKDWTRFEVR